jgi:hypothetical protein
MPNFSFDIVSDFDKSELINAFDQTQREIATRYDFKGTSANVEWIGDREGVKITGDNQFHIDSILDILRRKLSLRGQSQKILDVSQDPETSNMKVVQNIKFKKGISSDNAKKLSKLIRDEFPKLKPQIQGDEIRVTGAKKDELQAAMNLLRQQELEFDLQFINFR